MRKLVWALALLGIPAVIIAACLSNTVDLYNMEGNLSPSCGSDTLTNHGSLGFPTTPAPYQGTHEAGDYSATIYASDDNSTLSSNFSSLNNWTIEGEFCVGCASSASLATQPVITCLSSGSTGDHIAYRILSSGKVRLIIDDVATDSATAPVSTNVKYYFALANDNSGGHLHVYCFATGTAQTEVITYGSSVPTGTINEVMLGRLNVSGFEFPLNGTIDAVRFSSAYRTSFPSIDPSNTPTPTYTVGGPSNTPTPTASPSFTASPTNTPYETFTPNMTLTPAPTSGLAQIPPMYWNSFLPFGVNVNEAQITTTAKAMHDNGMAAAGWGVEIDGYWEGGRDMSGNLFPDPPRFPDGMKFVVDYVHSLGMPFCLYTGPNLLQCNGITPGSQGHQAQDAATWRSWDIGVNSKDAVYSDYCMPGQENPRDQNILMWNAFTTGGAPMVMFSGGPQNFSTSYFDYLNWEPGIANGTRIWPDGSDNYGDNLNRSYRTLSVTANFFPGSYVDVGGTTAGNGGQTAGQYRTDYAYNCMGPVAMWANTDMISPDSQALALFLNGSANAVNQDPLVKRACKTQDDTHGNYVWAKPLATPGKWAFCMFNENVSSNINTVTWTAAVSSYLTQNPTPGPLSSNTGNVYDIFNGNTSTGLVGSYSFNVPATDVNFFTVQFTTPTFTATPTGTPTGTPTPSPTRTPGCVVVGELTPYQTPQAGWQTCVFKPVTLGAHERVDSVSVYVKSGAGKIMAAFYDTSYFKPRLVATSNVISATAGVFNAIPFYSYQIPAGSYLIAVQGSSTVGFGSTSPGTDSYFKNNFGGFPSLVSPIPLYRDNSIYVTACNY